MNTANPFQIPSCLQADFQRRRQARFKKIVVASVIAGASGLVALLIAGCMSEQSKSASVTPPAMAAVQPAKMPVASLKPAQTFPLTPPAASVTAPVMTAASKPVIAQPISAPEAFYVVKSGDTLTRIAKLHRTTIKQLQAVNQLSSDKIVIGMKLKLPVPTA